MNEMVALLNTPELPRNTVICGDCLDVLRAMPDCSVDAIVTDPPAGVSFMNKSWDDPNTWPLRDRGERLTGNGNPTESRGFANGITLDSSKKGRDAFISFMTEVFTEALRVIRPGGHAFVWALPRTSHWTATALEDAGWEIREVVVHLFGSGFPKSHNISAAIDKMHGAEREVIGSKHVTKDLARNGRKGDMHVLGTATPTEIDITSPATPEAARYAGYGSALKPSNEHWILCRKPLSEPTIAQNVLRWNGCGGLNIDASRIGTQDNTSRPAGRYAANTYNLTNRAEPSQSHTQGRWPSNTLFSHTLYCRQTGVKRVRSQSGARPKSSDHNDAKVYGKYQRSSVNEISYHDDDYMETVDAWECDPSCPVRILGEQSGVRTNGMMKPGQVRNKSLGKGGYHGDFPDTATQQGTYGDTGTAARYFAQFSPSPDELEVPFYYAPKASRAERNRGCEGLPENNNPDAHNLSSNACGRCGLRVKANGSGKKCECGTLRETIKLSPTVNSHPTVKPLALCRYLARLITPPNGVILDPFMGSGSTGVAALQEGFSFIGIDSDESYVEIARARIQHAMQGAGIVEVQGDGEWECHPSCPVAALDRQSGIRKSGAVSGRQGYKQYNTGVYGDNRPGSKIPREASEGGASRYFAQFAPDGLWSLLENEMTE